MLAPLIVLPLIVLSHVVRHEGIGVTPVTQKGHDALVEVAVEGFAEAAVGGEQELFQLVVQVFMLEVLEFEQDLHNQGFFETTCCFLFLFF